MTRIRYAAIAAVLGLVSISAAHAAIDSPIHRNFNVRPGGTITIDADIGDIKVNSGAANVSVDVMRRAKTMSRSHADELFKDFDITFAQEGNDVRIRALQRMHVCRLYQKPSGDGLDDPLSRGHLHFEQTQILLC